MAVRLVAPGPPKICAECGFKRPRSDFYARRAPNGNLYAKDLCIEHDKARVMAWKVANRDRDRQSQRATYTRIRQDPERLAIRRDQQREWYRKRGVTLRAIKGGVRDQSPTVDAAPFVAWLRTLGNTSVTGMPSGSIRALLRGAQATIYLDTVDAALIHANTLTTLDDLFPMEVAV